MRSKVKVIMTNIEPQATLYPKWEMIRKECEKTFPKCKDISSFYFDDKQNVFHIILNHQTRLILSPFGWVISLEDVDLDLPIPTKSNLPFIAEYLKEIRKDNTSKALGVLGEIIYLLDKSDFFALTLMQRVLLKTDMILYEVEYLGDDEPDAICNKYHVHEIALPPLKVSVVQNGRLVRATDYCGVLFHERTPISIGVRCFGMPGSLFLDLSHFQRREYPLEAAESGMVTFRRDADYLCIFGTYGTPAFANKVEEDCCCLLEIANSLALSEELALPHILKSRKLHLFYPIFHGQVIAHVKKVQEEIDAHRNLAKSLMGMTNGYEKHLGSNANLLQAIDKLLGHSKDKINRLYRHLREVNAKKEIAKFTSSTILVLFSILLTILALLASIKF